LRDKCGLKKNPASKSYMKLVSLVKDGQYCKNNKMLGSFPDLKGCLNKIQKTTDDACSNGGGYFAYAPNSDGWCACCTNADDAPVDMELDLFGDISVKMYKTLSDILPVYKGCYVDTPNKSTKALASDDPHEQLAHRIITIAEFDYLHDGDHKDADLYFEDDG
jgi:hypothetical protein